MISAEELGKRILAFRKIKGFTQQELASRLYVDNKTISKWENGFGYPDLQSMHSMAKLFNCSLERFLDEKESEIEIKNKKNFKLLGLCLQCFVLIAIAVLLVVLKLLTPNSKIILDSRYKLVFYVVASSVYLYLFCINSKTNNKLKNITAILLHFIIIVCMSSLLYF